MHEGLNERRDACTRGLQLSLLGDAQLQRGEPGLRVLAHFGQSDKCVQRGLENGRDSMRSHVRAARGSVWRVSFAGGGLAGSDFMLGAAEWPANSVLQIIRCSWGMPHVVMTTVQPRRESRGAPPQLPESWVTWGSLALRHAALAFEGRRSLCIGPRLCCGRDSLEELRTPCTVTSETSGGVGSCFWRVVPPSALAQM